MVRDLVLPLGVVCVGKERGKYKQERSPSLSLWMASRREPLHTNPLEKNTTTTRSLALSIPAGVLLVLVWLAVLARLNAGLSLLYCIFLLLSPNPTPPPPCPTTGLFSCSPRQGIHVIISRRSSCTSSSAAGAAAAAAQQPLSRPRRHGCTKPNQASGHADGRVRAAGFGWWGLVGRGCM